MNENIRIKLVPYGIARDILGDSEKSMKVKEGDHVAVARQQLLSKFPAFSELASLRFAINEEYCDDDTPLKDGDELVIIPPVSGG